jgi:hypothetical protein
MPEDLDFDMSAAWMRRAQADLHAFLESFAVRMEVALPERVVVERRRDSIFSKTRHVERFTLSADGASYSLARRGAGVVATVSREVRAVTISSKEVPLREWILCLNRDMKAMAADSGSAYAVLHDVLAS